MAHYDVYVFCNLCGCSPYGDPNRANARPARKESIGDLYAGKELPENVGRLMNNQTTCPKTGKALCKMTTSKCFSCAFR